MSRVLRYERYERLAVAELCLTYTLSKPPVSLTASQLPLLRQTGLGSELFPFWDGEGLRHWLTSWGDVIGGSLGSERGLLLC
jgi:hypothetical protein